MHVHNAIMHSYSFLRLTGFVRLSISSTPYSLLVHMYMKKSKRHVQSTYKAERIKSLLP